MCSVEIVDVINALRGPGKAVMRHDHFMDKVKAHPGITGPNFRGFYSGGNGKQEPCYYLPKREAELMVSWPVLHPSLFQVAGSADQSVRPHSVPWLEISKVTTAFQLFFWNVRPEA